MLVSMIVHSEDYEYGRVWYIIQSAAPYPLVSTAHLQVEDGMLL